MQKLTELQIDKISDVALGIGHTAFASVALPAVLGNYQVLSAIVGLVTAIFFWTLSVWIPKKFL